MGMVVVGHGITAGMGVIGSEWGIGGAGLLIMLVLKSMTLIGIVELLDFSAICQGVRQDPRKVFWDFLFDKVWKRVSKFE